MSSSEIPNNFGNAAEMREALLAIHALFGAFVRHEIPDESLCLRAKNVINAALAEPPRNCDAGSVREQSDRFVEWCRSRKSATDGCKNCKLNESLDICAIEWSQMPYEGSGGQK